MSKKIISIDKYLKRKKSKVGRSKVESLKVAQVILIKAYLKAKKSSYSLKKAQGSEDFQESTNNIVSLNKFKKNPLPSEQEIFIEEKDDSNIVFATQRFKQRKAQRESNEQVSAFSLASYGVVATFLFMFTLSILLIQQGEKLNLALKSKEQTRFLAAEKEPLIITGRKPTQKEKETGR